MPNLPNSGRIDKMNGNIVVETVIFIQIKRIFFFTNLINLKLIELGVSIVDSMSQNNN